MYWVLQKRAESVFGLLHIAKTLKEAKKTKEYYHNNFKIPLRSIYILKPMGV
jgi:hypothetical protein